MIITEALVDHYIAGLTGPAERTRVAYRSALILVLQWEIPIDDGILQAFERALSKRTYAKTVRERQISAAGALVAGRLKTIRLKYAVPTRRLYVTALKQFLYWLEAENLAPAGFNRASAEARLKAARGRRQRTPYRHRAPDHELMRIVEYYDALPCPAPPQRDAARLTLELLRNRALLHTLRCTGGRVSEVLSIMRAQIADGTVDEIAIIGKGGESGRLFLDAPALSALRAYSSARNDSFRALFISHRRGLGEALTTSSAWQIVRRAAVALGLKGLASPHMFRHYLAEDMLRSGTRLEGVQAVLRHKQIGTTRTVYAPATVDEAREALKKYRGDSA